MEQRIRTPRRHVLVISAALVAVVLTGCAGSGSVPGETAASSPSVAAPAAAGTATGGGLATAAPSAPAPVSAIPLTQWRAPGYGSVRVGVLLSPSGNIGCDFGEDGSEGGCGVMRDDTKAKDEDGYTWVELGGSTAQKTVRNDAPYFGNVNEPAQVVAYGTTVATEHFACTSEQSGMTCWNRRTGAGAVMNRGQGARLITKKTPVSLGEQDAQDAGAAAQPPQPGDPSDATILSGYVPRSVVPEEGTPGRMTDGEYRGFEPDNPGAYVVIARGEGNSWKSDAVQYADIAGGPEREAIVILARSRGGVPWASSLLAYDSAGRVVWTWDTRDAGGDPRGGVTFTGTTGTSVSFNVVGTGRSSAAAFQSGESTYRIAKGANGKPSLALVSRRG